VPHQPETPAQLLTKRAGQTRPETQQTTGQSQTQHPQATRQPRSRTQRPHTQQPHTQQPRPQTKQPQNKTIPSSTDSSHRVIPAVDVSLGTVSFVINGRPERHWHPEPHTIVHALGQSVRPARWFPARQVLTITVAAAGRHAGLEKHFRFTDVKRDAAP
jgi:hypothetical protein